MEKPIIYISRSTSLSDRVDLLCVSLGAFLPVAILLGSAVFEPVVALAGLLWLGRLLAERKRPLFPVTGRSLMVPWLVWYGVIVASLVWNGPGGKGWAHDIGMVRFSLFALAMFDVSERRDIVRPLIYGIGACVLVALLNVVMARYLGHDLLGNGWTRYAGKLKEGYRVAALLQYIVPFFFCWSMVDRTLAWKNRVLMLLLSLGGCWMLGEIGMRTAIGAALGGLYATLLYVFRRRPLVLTASLALGGLATVFLLQVLLSGDPVVAHKLASLYARFEIWKVCIQMWHQYPLLGSGISAFQETYHQVATTSGVLAGNRVYPGPPLLEATHAHNLVLMLLAGTGLAGYLAFFWLFSSCLRLIVDDHHHWRAGLLTWPVVLFISGLTGFNIYGSSYQAVLALFIVLIGMRARGPEVI